MSSPTRRFSARYRATRGRRFGEVESQASRPRWRGRWLAIGTGLVAVLVVGLGLGVAAAQAGSRARTAIECPTVSDRLPAVPAAARVEVARNRGLLNARIAE